MKTRLACLTALAMTTAAFGQTSSLTYFNGFSTDLAYPARLAPRAGGGVYVTDPPTGQVIAYDGLGAVVGTYPIAEQPVGIAAHTDGRVFVSRGDGAIGVYDAAFTALGVVDPAPMTLTEPNDLAFDPVAGELYAVDSGAHRVLVFTESAPGTWTWLRAWGEEGSGLGQFMSPQAIDIDPVLGHVLVTDTDNFRVQVFDTTGMLQFKFGYRILYTATTETAWFARSEGIAVDGCSNIYVVDALMGTVRVFNSAGKELGTGNIPVISYGTAAATLRVPCDVAIDALGRFYVASTNNGAIEVYDLACTAGSIAAEDAASEELPGRRTAKMVSDRTAPRGGSARAMSVELPNLPDNPAVVAEAVEAGEYRPDLDLNRDNSLDTADLAVAVGSFGAGTVEDFLGGVAVSHPSLNYPHIIDINDRCGRCHSMDGAPGGMLTGLGQENLCQSCHSAGKVAGAKPIAAGDTGMSHPWGIAADAGVSDGPAAGSELLLHLEGNKVRCGTCHEPHEAVVGTCDKSRPPIPSSPWIGVCVDGPFEGKYCSSNDQCALGYIRTQGDTANLCGECHAEYDQWLHAGHSDKHADPFSHYDWSLSNRSACRQCHSGNGYVDFTNGLPAAQQHGNFRVLDCLVCHSTHGAAQSGDLLRVYDTVTLPGDPVNFPTGVTFTGVGGSATCMVCHNGRSAPPVQSSTTTTLSTPHYLLGGVMLEGINGAEFGYTISQNTDHQNNLGCTDCHMAATPAAGQPGSGKVGGHTFNMKVHDAADPDFGFENVANACQGCHTGLTTLNRPAGGDYDGDGALEGVQDEVRGLLDAVLGALQAKGAVQLSGYPYWNITAVAVADRIVVKNSIWNWEFVDNSGDLGVKNTGYAVGLLQVSYIQLTGAPLAWSPRYAAP